MLNSLGLEQYTDFNNCVNKKMVLENVNEKLWEYTIEKWKESLYREVRTGSNKLRTYRRFKHDFKTEMYLKKPMSLNVKRSFASLRCGNSPLRIETGRYEGLAVEERVCELCNNGVEDEFHFMILCPAFNTERRELYLSISDAIIEFNQLSDIKKFEIIMNEEEICKYSAQTCSVMFRKRRQILYKSN